MSSFRSINKFQNKQLIFLIIDFKMSSLVFFISYQDLICKKTFNKLAFKRCSDKSDVQRFIIHLIIHALSNTQEFPRTDKCKNS